MNISFENPAFLWASALVLIPILLHLFNLQIPKTVYFSSNKFLKKVTTETKKSSTIKRLLLLLARVIAVISFAVAFAKPYIPLGQDTQISKENILICIDNSNSMSALSAQGTCLDYAKQLATSIVQNSDKNAKFWIADNNTVYASKKPIDRSKATEAISNIQMHPKPRPISKVIEKAFWKANSNIAEAFVFSDCQTTTFDYSNINDSTIKLKIIPIVAQTKHNISIDSCWYESNYHKPDDTDSISVQLKNFSDEEQQVPIRLYINDSLKNITNILLQPGNSTHSIRYKNPMQGNIQLKVAIEDFPITFDNTYYYAYILTDKIMVLELGDGVPALATKAMYSNRENIIYSQKNIKNFTPSDLEEYSLTIVSDLGQLTENTAIILKKYVEQGGSLFIAPKDNAKTNNAWQALQHFGISIDSVGTAPVQLKNLSKQEELFAHSVKRSENIQLATILHPLYATIDKKSNKRELLRFSNNKSAFSQISLKEGKVYFSSIALSQVNSEFISSPIIAPLLYNIALLSAKCHSSNTIVGTEAIAPLQAFGENRIEIVDPQGTIFSPDYRIDRFNKHIVILPTENMASDGFYQLQTDVGSIPIACNLDRAESDLQTVSVDELSSFFKDKGNIVVSEPTMKFEKNIRDDGINKKEFWIAFVALGIMFLFIEKLIIVTL